MGITIDLNLEHFVILRDLIEDTKHRQDESAIIQHALEIRHAQVCGIDRFDAVIDANMGR